MAESRRPGAGALGPKSKGMVPLAPAPPTEPGPGASPVPVPEEGCALPKLTQRGRKGRSLLSSRPQWRPGEAGVWRWLQPREDPS